MPERYVSVRWPDGHAQRIYSPSTVVEDYFAAGERVPVGEFVARSRVALGAASDRVRAAYGFPCGRAAAALAEVTATAGRYAAGVVTVERIEP
ncbi:MSMEG_0570 family nitrogen starvation response protein [Actinoplanes sp. CA-030573]|uniref:MSMEG_0570 family nitrogen starvation response protein n=1 Tax=Actinoplanes sp. CA-030573 TaxID=3239898 RepID=UPI003D8FB5D9